MTTPARDLHCHTFCRVVPGHPAVRIRRRVMEAIDQDVREVFAQVPRRGAETGGILLGTRDDRNIVVEDFESIPSEHRFGPLYRLSDADHDLLTETLDWVRKGGHFGLSVVGFYRGHAREEFALAPEDHLFLQESFAPEERLLLLIHPRRSEMSEADLFFWEDGALRPGLGPLPFPFAGGAEPAVGGTPLEPPVPSPPPEPPLPEPPEEEPPVKEPEPDVPPIQEPGRPAPLMGHAAGRAPQIFLLPEPFRKRFQEERVAPAAQNPAEPKADPASSPVVLPTPYRARIQQEPVAPPETVAETKADPASPPVVLPTPFRARIQQEPVAPPETVAETKADPASPPVVLPTPYRARIQQEPVAPPETSAETKADPASPPVVLPTPYRARIQQEPVAPPETVAETKADPASPPVVLPTPFRTRFQEEPAPMHPEPAMFRRIVRDEGTVETAAPADRGWLRSIAALVLAIGGTSLAYVALRPDSPSPAPVASSAERAAPPEMQPAESAPAPRAPAPVPAAAPPVAQPAPAAEAPVAGPERTLEHWAAAIQRGDIDAAVHYYEPKVGLYFSRRNVSHEEVRASLKRTLGAAGRMDVYRLSNLSVHRSGPNEAVVTFRKRWQTAGRRKLAGEGTERVTLVRRDGGWRIVTEQEERVYWVHQTR